MTDTFGAGLNRSLDSLLGTMRDDRRERQAMEFKQRLISDERKSNAEIADRVRKQKAKELFGEGLFKLQAQKQDLYLNKLVGKTGKSQVDNKAIEHAYDLLNKAEARLKDYTLKSASLQDAVQKRGNDLGSLEMDKTAVKEINFLEKDIAKTQQEIDGLQKYIRGAESNAVLNQQKLNDYAQKVKESVTLDDILNSREAEVLRLSLGLTPEDVADFKTNQTQSGKSLDSLINEFNPQTYQESILSNTDTQDNNITPTTPTLDNPVKRARLKEKLGAIANEAGTNITALSSLTGDEYQIARTDPEFAPLLDQIIKNTQDNTEGLKKNLMQGKIGDPEKKALDSIALLGKNLSPDQVNNFRKLEGSDGSTVNLQAVSSLFTPDVSTGLSKYNERRNIELSKTQGDLQKEINQADSGYSSTPTIFGNFTRPNPKYKYSEDLYQKMQGDLSNTYKESKSLNDLLYNYNSLSSYLQDPSKQYQYRPLR